MNTWRKRGKPAFAEDEAQHAKPAGHGGMRASAPVASDVGAKDRITMLPESLKPPLRHHLEKVKTKHDEDKEVKHNGIIQEKVQEMQRTVRSHRGIVSRKGHQARVGSDNCLPVPVREIVLPKLRVIGRHDWLFMR